MLSSTVNTPNKSLYKILNKVKYSILADWSGKCFSTWNALHRSDVALVSGQNCNGVPGWKH